MAQDTSQTAQLPETLRQAVTAHQAGDHESAYPLYKQFVQDNPTHPTALQLFGLLLSQRGALEPGIALMRESLRLFPEQAEVANNLGNALARAGQVNAAIDSYSNALRIFPRYVDALRNLGLAHVRIGQLKEAVDCYERIIELRPDDAPTWLLLGNVRQQQNELNAAVTCYEKALSLNPEYAKAHHNLGLSLRMLNRADEALSHYEKASSLGLDAPELFHNRANALADLSRRDEAIDAYRAAVKGDPGHLESHRNLNSLLWQQNKLDDYLSSYRDALNTSADAVDLRLAYAATLNQHERHDEAAQVLEEGLARAPGSSEMRSQLAYTREGQNRWDEALLLHEEAVKTQGSTPNHRVSFARALLACRQPDRALEHASSAAAETPYNQRALAYLGLCWRMLDDPRDEVLNDYDNLIQVYELPTPREFASTPEFNAQLQVALERLHVGKQHPAEQTLRGGSQTSGNLFDRREPEIAALVSSLSLCIKDYIGRMPENNEHPLYARRSERFNFYASWSVRLARAGFHTMHTHPLGWISSAYYVQVPDAIRETDEHGGGIKFGEPDIDIGEKGAARRKIQPAAGRLVLFPSYMWHGTVPFDADEPRMTVAFDVAPVS